LDVALLGALGALVAVLHCLALGNHSANNRGRLALAVLADDHFRDLSLRVVGRIMLWWRRVQSLLQYFLRLPGSIVPQYRQQPAA
jgi:hypothetical protein